ncbi:hypothetical protein [Microbulbifer sp. TRSA007]|uniref:hypothetical protein n=1 Tax=Microbulbifer sp. TRSA007 TaxID=3243384 RepID=UPI0040395C7F
MVIFVLGAFTPFVHAHPGRAYQVKAVGRFALHLEALTALLAILLASGKSRIQKEGFH